jgi:hypothetical protein
MNVRNDQCNGWIKSNKQDEICNNFLNDKISIKEFLKKELS